MQIDILPIGKDEYEMAMNNRHERFLLVCCSQLVQGREKQFQPGY